MKTIAMLNGERVEARRVAGAVYRIQGGRLVLTWTEDGEILQDEATDEEIADSLDAAGHDGRYAVEVRCVGGWTTHSHGLTYREAVDQADMVHGRIVPE